MKKQTILVIFSYIILALTLLLYLLTSLQIRSDVSFFISDTSSDEEQIIQSYLSEGDANRLLFIKLGNENNLISIESSSQVNSFLEKPSQEKPSQESNKKLAELSNKLKQQLLKSEHFIAVENGQQSINRSFDNQLYQYRYLLRDLYLDKALEGEESIWDIGFIKRQFQIVKQRLQLVISAKEQQFISENPLNIWFNYLKSINTTQLIKIHGVWFNDKEQAILLLKTKSPGFDIEQQKDNISYIKEQLKSLNLANKSYVLSGIPIIAIENSNVISFQIKVISSIASIILAVFLFSLFKSFKFLILVSLPLFFAIIVGMSVVNFFYSYIHGISLAFGITIIGVAVDYPIHYFSQLIGNDKETSLVENKKIILRIWPKLKVGLITTLVGFSAITFSSFSGLNQLGIFAISGLITAVLITRYLLPLFAYQTISYQSLTYKRAFNRNRQMINWLTYPFRFYIPCFFRYITLLLMMASIVYISTHDKLWENDLSSLSPVSQNLKQEDFKLRKSLNLPELRYLVMISGKTEQEVMRNTEELSPFLDQLIEAKSISFYDSISRYIPSIQVQEKRQKELPDTQQLQKKLQLALDNTPFNIEAFNPFIRAVVNSKQLDPLQPREFKDSLFSAKISSLVFKDKNSKKWISLIFLSGVDGERLTHNFKQYSPMIENIKLIDIKQQTDNLVKDYRIEASYWFLWGSFFIVLFLLFYTKKIIALPALVIPFSGAIIFTLSLLLFFGYSLNIFHLVTLLLVVGLGIDYSIFIYDAHSDTCLYTHSAAFSYNKKVLKKMTLFSVSVCAISSFIMFFALSLSSIPVLKAIGLTASIGAILAFILSLIFTQDCNSKIFLPRAKIIH
jgi:predicted exporter